MSDIEEKIKMMDKEESLAIGKRLKESRFRFNDLSQDAMAKALGLGGDNGRIGTYERGRQPKLGFIKHWCELTGDDPIYIMFGHYNSNNPALNEKQSELVNLIEKTAGSLSDPAVDAVVNMIKAFSEGPEKV